MIDAHLHFWDAEHATHKWPDTIAARLQRGFSPDDLVPEMAIAGVSSIVLMQSRNDFAESLHFASLAKRHDFIGALIGWVDLDNPAQVGDQMAVLAKCGKLRGVRHLINFEPDGSWLLRNRVQQAIAALARSNLILDVVPTDDTRFACVLETARNHPDLRIVIDHMARPPVGREPGRWAEQVREAAALPNIFMKVSVGLDVVVGWQWRHDDLAPFVSHLVDCFGPARLMAASNWPVILGSTASYSQTWAHLQELLAGLDPDAQRQILGGTAGMLFGISDR